MGCCESVCVEERATAWVVGIGIGIGIAAVAFGIEMTDLERDKR